MTTSLTFKNGAFALVADGHIVKPLTIQAALRFRHLADKSAERVFNRVLVKFFEAPTELPPFLDAHQRDGVTWILSRSRSYLAHAPGAGKTAQAIVASLLAKAPGQTVFIVPPTLTINWAREILKWTAWTGLWYSTYIVGRTAFASDADWGADFIIVPDSMLTKSWVYEKLSELKPVLLAVDEASRFKEPTSERTKALFGGRTKTKTYYGLIQNARHAVLLDGSPMPNRPMELWAPTLAMSGETIDFMDQHKFGVKYCDGYFDEDKYDWVYRGASNQEEFKKRLQGSFMHVVGEDKLGHPERLRSLVYMTDQATPELRKWSSENVGKINLNEIDESLSVGDIALRRQEIGLLKVDWVANYVRERLEKNESVIVFAWHREVCARIAKNLSEFKPGLIVGGTPSEVRERVFKSFQDGHTKAIVGNIAAMGRGHNLQRATRVVFLEYSWTDEHNKQCEKRASRKGATQEFVRCDYVVLPNTLDETVLSAVFTKSRNVERVIGR